MSTKGGARGRARARSRAELKEGASSDEEMRARDAREIRIARRRRVVEQREQMERNDRDARLHVVWQQTRTLSEEEAVRQAEAAMQIARNRVDDPLFFTSDEEGTTHRV